VLLDPTLDIGGASICDTRVVNTCGSNVGVHDAMIVADASGNLNAGVQSNGQGVIVIGSHQNVISRGLFRWDIPAAIAENPITDAKFTPWLGNFSTFNTGTLKVQPITTAWNEATVVWNSQPQVDPTLVMTKSVGVSGWGTNQVDVLPWIRRWQADPNHVNNGIMVKLVDGTGVESLSSGRAELLASETYAGAYGAALRITYDNTSTLPTAATLVSPISSSDPSDRAIKQ
jgi:hypothetical protein